MMRFQDSQESELFHICICSSVSPFPSRARVEVTSNCKVALWASLVPAEDPLFLSLISLSNVGIRIQPGWNHSLASNRSRATGEPFPAHWRPSLCVSQIHLQPSDFVWQNWRATGADQAKLSIKESCSSACAAKHDRVTSMA